MIINRMATLAIKLIEREGGPMSLTFSELIEYEPETATTNKHEYTYPCNGYMFEYEHKEIDGQSILRGDMRVLIAPDIAVTPEPGSILDVSGVIWNVIKSRPIFYRGSVAVHDVQVRR